MSASPLRGLAFTERWFLRAGLFLLPLGFAWDTYDQYVLPKLLIARIILLGLLLLFVVRAALSGQLVVKRTPLDLPLLAFVASALISTVFAENLNVAIFGTYSRYDGLLTLTTYVGIFWLSVQILSSADEARGLLRVLLASGYVVAVLAIVLAAGNWARLGTVGPVFGTMGSPLVLGAFLAMVLMLGLGELVIARGAAARVVLINVVIVVGLALVLSFSRAAWLGAAVGTAIVIAGVRRAAVRLWVPAAVAVIAGAGLVVVAVAGRGLGATFLLERLLGERGLTLLNVGGWGTSRLHIWRDSLSLIASRPLAGYGPDNFGLVYPRFATGDWGLTHIGNHEQIDKAHAETLQVAATQGLIGLAVYAWILVTFGRSFWPARRSEGAVAVLAAFVAYQVTIQLNFTALASAFPFWILTAAGMVIFGAAKPIRVVVLPWRAPLLAGSWFVAVALVVLVVPVVVYPYTADSQLRLAVDVDSQGRSQDAQVAAAWATGLAPEESVYAVEVANVAFERRDLEAARLAYQDAIRLGTYNPFVYMDLAIVDDQLGRHTEALSAAHKALELNRFDPAAQALVAQLESPSP